MKRMMHIGTCTFYRREILEMSPAIMRSSAMRLYGLQFVICWNTSVLVQKPFSEYRGWFTNFFVVKQLLHPFEFVINMCLNM